MGEHTNNSGNALAAALRHIYHRSRPLIPWRDGNNLPWDEPAFSDRMLREHLDQSHVAASRRLPEIRDQVQVMWWDKLALQDAAEWLVYVAAASPENRGRREPAPLFRAAA